MQSALDGYHVCIFSYGQTGSGKTHTMSGSGTGPLRGIIPRAMEVLDQERQRRSGEGWSFTMSVTFLEIYLDNIRDLLREPTKKPCEHEVKQHPLKGTWVTNLTQVPVDVDAVNEVQSMLMRAARLRQTASTEMNDTSSRSHSVFTVHIAAHHTYSMGGGGGGAGENKGTGSELALSGRLNLVDLAGSERVGRSAATGERLKEAQNINKSLSALTDVFVALANKQPHVPFRNSRLTYLLQPALGGEGKTLMLVNLSPTLASHAESLNSLRFAERVNQVELGKARRHVVESGGSVSGTSSLVPSEGAHGSGAGGNGTSTHSPPRDRERRPSTPSGARTTPRRASIRRNSLKGGSDGGGGGGGSSPVPTRTTTSRPSS